MKFASNTLRNITLSRTFAPITPPHFLLRRNLFKAIDCPAPGTTLVIAPSGFGKSTLIAEWAAAQTKKVFWLTITENDSLQDLSSLFIQATRNVIPGFAPWFEINFPMRATEVVQRWASDLLELKEEFVLVLDYLRQDRNSDLIVASKLIALFPKNLHFIAIRQTQDATLHAACAARGEVRVVGENLLRFSEAEINQLAENFNLDVRNPEIQKAISAARGWPTATSMILHHLRANQGEFRESNLFSPQTSSLQPLVRALVEQMSPSEYEAIRRLSVVEEFDHQLAEYLLEDLYRFETISNLGLSGEIISTTNSKNTQFTFSPLMRRYLLDELRSDSALLRKLNNRLSQYFENLGRHDLAMDFAFRAGNQEVIHRLFRDSARLKLAQGKGDDLIRYSEYAAQSPEDGAFKKQTLMVSGYLANLDFSSAQAELDKLNLIAGKAVNPEFFQQFAAAAQCFLNLSSAKFEAFDLSATAALESVDGLNISVDERLMVYRMMASRHIIFQEVEVIQEIYSKASSEASESLNDTTHAYLSAIKAMALLQMGEFRQAFEAATVTLSQFQRIGIVGLLGPLDMYYVIARCHVEFSNREEAWEAMKKVSSLAKSWSQWHYHFVAEGFFARELATAKNFDRAVELIHQLRQYAASLFFPHELERVIDLADLFIQYERKDWTRVNDLLKRAYQNRMTERISIAAQSESGNKPPRELPENFPTFTAIDRIYKHLNDAEMSLGKESEAIEHMKLALAEGARVGVKEWFLRQGPGLGNLIIKIANSNPTVYNEDLARAMAERIKEREMSKAESGQALTKRELEILRQLTTGRTLTVIASELHISQNTMKTHLKNLYRKLSALDRDDAVAKAKALFLI